MKLGAFTYWYNMSKFDYPCVESVYSILPAVDQLVICECQSEDDTWEIAQKLQAEFPDKIKLVRRRWVKHFTQISSVANFAMDALDDDIEWVIQLQADEVLHENSLFELRALPERLLQENKTAARVHYTHFMANYETTFPFCYEAIVRVANRRKGWEVIGDGVQFAKPFGGVDNIPENEVADSTLQVFHYGKVKDPEKGWKKEWEFQQLYKDIGFPDPKMMEMVEKLGKQTCDYVFLFEDHVKKGTIRKFEGKHPTVMQERIQAFKAGGYEQFVSMVKDNVKITFGDLNEQ